MNIISYSVYIVTCHDIRSYSICERGERGEREIALQKYWTDSNTHIEQLMDIIDAATIIIII